MGIPLRMKLLLWVVNNDKTQTVNAYDSAAEARKRTTAKRAKVANLIARPIVEMESVENRKIVTPVQDIPIRIYYPTKEKNLPITVYFHGGGFVLGNLDSHDRVCRRIASGSNSIVVSVDYRLAPEHPFPAPIDDCYAATEWVTNNAESIGGDSTKIAVAGDSAGANLATVVATLARDRNGPKICHQGLVYPCTDFTMTLPSINENAKGYFLEKDSMIWFRSHYTQDREDYKNPLLSPLYADVQNLPPATVITAGYDPLKDEGIAYKDKLKEAGVPVNFVHYKNMIHGFFNMCRLAKDSVKAMDIVCADLRKSFNSLKEFPIKRK